MLCLDEDEWAEPRPKSILMKFCWMLCLDEDEWAEPRPKSILKKRQGSTDDELEERPKSILKSRASPPLKSRQGLFFNLFIECFVLSFYPQDFKIIVTPIFQDQLKI
jgi:hypothetical protein